MVPVVAVLTAVGLGMAVAGSGSFADAVAPGAPAQSWAMAGHDASNDRDNPAEHLIGPGNVAAVRPIWSRAFPGTLAGTPAVVGGLVYVADRSGALTALDGNSGAIRWTKPVSAYTGVSGDAARATPAVVDGRLIDGDYHSGQASTGASVFAADPVDGRRLWSTQVSAHPNAIITGAPTVIGGVAYVGISSDSETDPTCCTFRGSVVALSASTGKILWRRLIVPAGYTGGAVWGSSPAVDPALGLVYVATGNNYTVPPGVCLQAGATGCAAPPADDYDDSILALHISDGSVAWALRTRSSDVWSILCPLSCGPDADFGSSPNLFTVGQGAARRELVGAGQKSGVYWALDARTGALVWDTRVGPGSVTGGVMWGSATDGKRVYVAESGFSHQPYQLQPSGNWAFGGSIAGLDAATGKFLWQTADPHLGVDLGYVSTANGVVYAGSTDVYGTDMYAYDATTGAIRASYAAGGSVMAGAAVVNGHIYWPSGYSTPTGLGQTCLPFPLPTCTAPNVLHAFALPA
jgi:polyvinyl alcohol dehydrogenase (cytochrome)